MTSVARAVVVLAAFILMGRFTAEAQTPLDHLSQAERILSAIPQESLKKDQKKQMDQLRAHFAELINTYRVNGDPFVPPADTSATDAKPDAQSDSANWKEKFSEVENDLGRILGGVPAPPPADVRGQLEQFRLELELFFASALGFTSEARQQEPAG